MDSGNRNSNPNLNLYFAFNILTPNQRFEVERANFRSIDWYLRVRVSGWYGWRQFVYFNKLVQKTLTMVSAIKTRNECL